MRKESPDLKSFIASCFTLVVASSVVSPSLYVNNSHLARVLDAVKQRAGSPVQVSFAQGTLGLQPLPMLPGTYLKTPNGQSGVQAEYFANPGRDFSGKPLAVRTEPTLSLDKPPAIDGLPEHLQWSVRYTTVFTPEHTGTQRFTLSGSGEARLFIGGKLVGEIMRADFQDIIYSNIPMTAKKPVEIRVEYSPREAIGDHTIQRFGIVFGPNLSLGWAGPDKKIDEAAEIARKAYVAVNEEGPAHHISSRGLLLFLT
jgi:beta-glucosidase